MSGLDPLLVTINTIFFMGTLKITLSLQRAESFRISGTFASDLGDAMPLALANVLGMPLVILSLDHFTQFLHICPREVKCGVFPIFLCHCSNNVDSWAYGKEKIRGAERNLPDFFGLCPRCQKEFSGETVSKIVVDGEGGGGGGVITKNSY
jgi:hypothetical protein